MERIMAEEVGKKAKALKHCIKLLGTIEKKGSAEVVLNCTGVRFTVRSGDAMHLKIATTKAQLEEEIASFEIVRASAVQQEANATPPPNESTPSPQDKREERRAYMREYMRKKRAKIPT